MTDKSEKTEIIKRIFAETGGLSLMSVGLILFAFYPYAIGVGNGWALTFTLFFALLLPLIIMPIIYNLIHAIKSKVLGRFHLPLCVCTISAPMFLALTFSADGNPTSDAVKIFFGLLFFAVFFMTFEYSAASIRVRIGRRNLKHQLRTHSVFRFIGLGATVVTLSLTYAFNAPVLTSVYCAATVMSAAGLLEYLATYSEIPQLTSSRPRPRLVDTFKLFYKDLRKLTFFTLVLFAAAFFIVTAYIASVAATFPPWVYSSMLAAFMVGYLAAYFATVRVQKRMTHFVPLTCLLLLLAAVALGCVPQLRTEIFLICAPFLIGAALALLMRESSMRFTTIKRAVTSGVVSILFNLALACAFAIALFTLMLAVQIPFLSTYINYFALGVSVLFALAGYIVSFKRYARKRIITKEVELKYDLNPETVDLTAKVDSIMTADDEYDESHEEEDL